MNLIAALSDKELYKKCQEYGLNAKVWLRKFEALLPEVMRRGLYKKRGFASIHEFAGKLAGMSHEKVNTVLRVAGHLEDKPALRALFEEGKVGYSKIQKVLSVVTSENEAQWAEKVVTLPQPALEVYVREHGEINRVQSVLQNASQPEKVEQEWSTISFKVKPEMEFELRIIKQKLEKGRGQALSFGEVLQELIKNYNEPQTHKIPENSEAVMDKTLETEHLELKQCTNEFAEFGIVTRHMPVAVQRFVMDRQKGYCAWIGCNKPPEIFHHTRRYALQKNHDPDFIVHLCEVHERIAHAGLIHNEEQSPKNWQLLDMPDTDSRKFRIDRKVMAFRQAPDVILSP